MEAKCVVEALQHRSGELADAVADPPGGYGSDLLGLGLRVVGQAAVAGAEQDLKRDGATHVATAHAPRPAGAWTGRGNGWHAVAAAASPASGPTPWRPDCRAAR